MVQLVEHPELWCHVDVNRVLHEVYHATDVEAFQPNERPHWFFVRRMTSYFIKALKDKEARIEFLERTCEDLHQELILANNIATENNGDPFKVDCVNEASLPQSEHSLLSTSTTSGSTTEWSGAEAQVSSALNK